MRIRAPVAAAGCSVSATTREPWLIAGASVGARPGDPDSMRDHHDFQAREATRLWGENHWKSGYSGKRSVGLGDITGRCRIPGCEAARGGAGL
jgi:hypothetical protein